MKKSGEEVSIRLLSITSIKTTAAAKQDKKKEMRE